MDSLETTTYDESLARPRFYLPLAKPIVTQVLIGVIAAVFVGEIIYGYTAYDTWDGPNNLNVLVDMGAKVNQLIVAGEFWRLFTAMFLHIGVMHLLFNLYALYAIGSLVEAYYGHLRFLAIYLVGGLFGSLASFAFSPAVSAGASGAVFALTGALALYLYRYRENLGARGRQMLQNMVLIIVVNLIFGMVGAGIDNWGHMGGLVGGVLVAWGVMPRYEVPATVRLGDQPLSTQRRDFFEITWIVFCGVLLVAGVIVAPSL
jgi:rhomboid protease GluP